MESHKGSTASLLTPLKCDGAESRLMVVVSVDTFLQGTTTKDVKKNTHAKDSSRTYLTVEDHKHAGNSSLKEAQT